MEQDNECADPCWYIGCEDPEETDCICADPEDPDCIDRPFACFIRKTFLIGIEVISLVKTFLLLLPQLAQFNYDGGNKATFLDVDPGPLITLFYEAIDCLTSWIDSLDPNECRTDVPPPGIPGINNETHRPDGDTLYPPPTRYASIGM